MLSTFPNQVIQVNPRSVLRPEYFEHPYHRSNERFTKPSSLDERYNTNTAPVYSSNNPGPGKKRLNRRTYNHPYSRPNRNSVLRAPSPHLSSAILDNSFCHTACSIPVKQYVSSDSDESSHFPNAPRFACPKFPSGSLPSRYPKPGGQNKSQRECPNTTRSSAHGQAEQLRRSRESNTFALIDALLSKPPLSQIRDMYIQTRTASNPSSSHSASRATKKVNLSVVHLAVRFRIKEYLRNLQDYARFLLDTLFSNMFDDYQSGMRNELATKLLGLSRLPCTPQCSFCSELLSGETHTKTGSRHYDCVGQDGVFEAPAPSPDTSVRPSSSSSSNNSTTPMLSGSDVYAELHELSVMEHLVSAPATEVLSDVRDKCPVTSKCVLKEIGSEPKIKRSPSDHDLPVVESMFEKPLATSQVFELHEPSSKRRRLDSFTLRLCSDFDNVDWSSSDVGLSSYGEDPIDLHTLVNETGPDFLQLRDSLFDSVYEPVDLLQPFLPDKPPSLPCISSP
ncbi:hypothetical protein CRM22_010189 [Opisthorchis felineus]|uniref:Uncharacterized protein n=1 Tax=Opisthorchis felineus TaxID=147828 RepID=A0A4S2L0U2_OPIFE|nr:hypothetical protein CRM22_010189 [Opisthorchis felineus]